MLKKITGPGLFRLFLALVVFAHHCTRFAVGTSAVFVFFTLSGFWVYKMYMGRYRLTRQPYLTYMVSRAWRLLPSFWLISMLAMLFLYANGSLARYWATPDRLHFVVSNLFILGYNELPMRPIVPAWSLDVEMQFYLIAPLIAVLLAWRKAPPVWVVLAAAAVSLASSILHNPIALASFLVFFVIGMTAASVDWRPSGRLVLVCLAAEALLIVCCLASPWRGVLLVGSNPGPDSIYTPHANVVLAVLIVPYAIYTTWERGFSADGMLADLSYLVYLLHWIAIMWLDSHRSSIFHRLFIVLAAWVLVMGLSFAIWKFYDHPINRLRSRWVRSRRMVAAGEAEQARAAQDGRAT